MFVQGSRSVIRRAGGRRAVGPPRRCDRNRMNADRMILGIGGRSRSRDRRRADADGDGVARRRQLICVERARRTVVARRPAVSVEPESVVRPFAEKSARSSESCCPAV